MVDLSVKIGKTTLKNPLMAASGTFGYGSELSGLVDLGSLGAVITKTITRKPKEGSSPPRTAEVSCGMLNAIGLENVGLEAFLREKLPSLEEVKTRVVVSIGGKRAEDYKILAERMGAERRVDALEVNISCPNLKEERLIAQDAGAAEAVVRKVRKATSKTLIVKLSPEVTDIREIARACEDAGADAISLINSVPAMAVDIRTCRPKLANVTGGLSGPAIKPIALRLVFRAAQRVKIPVIGVGGIMDAHDALEFFLAGASAFQVGCANFVDPGSVRKIIGGIRRYCREKKIKKIRALVGKMMP